MRLLDSDRLVRFLHHAEDNVRSPVAQAVYAGLETRITRGEFDHNPIALEL